PQYDFVYLGDCARLPYGTRSPQTVYDFTREGVEFLFRRGCKLVILACNTASAQALRKIQKGFLPKHYLNNRVLGMVVPTLEAVGEQKLDTPLFHGREKEEYQFGRSPHVIKRLGVIGTSGTINSKVYPTELAKIRKSLKVFQQPTPLLVPLIEQQAERYLPAILKDYLRPLQNKKIDGLVLGCTHYPIIKKQIKKILGAEVRVFSQDEIIPEKLSDYLRRHTEIEKKLSHNRRREFFVTDLTPVYQKLAFQWFGEKARLRKIKI
ncbi:MAG: aspartate/glutamate racemase family protein, partial [Patescibacteria group bacterium]